MPLNGTRVLVVEDEAMLLIALREMLSDIGCEVAASEADLKGALQSARGQTFDVALLDIDLAGINVSPVADVLAARGIPFAFASGYCSGRIPPRYANRPRAEKPYRTDDLRAALMRALGKAQHQEGTELRQ
jgi:CheY-like chemotaxis protein